MKVHELGAVNRSRPPFIKDFHGGRETVEVYPGKINAAEFPDYGGVRVQLSAAALAGAVALAVDALPREVPQGALLVFGAGLYARVTVAAAAGAMALTVEALPAGLADNAVAYYSLHNSKYIPAGTIVGRTAGERSGNQPWGAGISTDAELRLTAFDIVDANLENDCEFIRRDVTIAENYLPQHTREAMAASAPLDTALRAIYNFMIATD